MNGILTKEFKAKIEENIEVHMPEDDGISKYVYLCIKSILLKSSSSI